MNNSEKFERHLRKAKTWNMVLLIITGISVLMSIAGLPSVFNPQMVDTAGLPAESITMLEDIFEFQSSFGVKAYTVVILLVEIAILVLLFLNNRKVKEEQLPSKIPYFLTFAIAVVQILYSILLTPSLEVDGMDVGFVAAIFAAIFVLIASLFTVVPAIVALVHTFKADVEE